MFTKASIVALLAAVASAQHAPVGDQPQGNPIAKPGLQEVRSPLLPMMRDNGTA